RAPRAGGSGAALSGSEPLELGRVVRAEERDLPGPLAGQLAQALDVAGVAAAVEGRRGRERAQARRAGRGIRDLAAVEVGVPAVEEPAALAADGDAGVAARVPGERHERHLRAAAGQHAHALEAEPAVA